jgi:hypothetical protein
VLDIEGSVIDSNEAFSLSIPLQLGSSS